MTVNTSKEGTTETEKTVIPFLLLAFLAIMLFVPGLGLRDLWSHDEPRVAGIITEMATQGDLVVPRLNHKPFLEKPPLFFWVTAACMRAFGENPFAARLPSALAAVGGVLALFLLARSMGFNPRAAFIAGFLLASSGEYWHLGQVCLIDMLLCFFILCSMATYFQVHRTASRSGGWYALFIAFLSCAVFTKGLVGLAIPLTAISAWLIVTKRFAFRNWFFLCLASLLCLIPVGIWVAVLYNRLGFAGAYEVVWINNFGRFTGSRTSHLQPFYYYLINFPLQFLPWTLFVPMAVHRIYRKFKERRMDDSAWFLLAWFIVPILLLSLSAGKRGIYMLPLYPAAALLTASALAPALESGTLFAKRSNVFLRVLAGIVLLAGVVFFGAGVYFDQSILYCFLLSLPCIGLGAWIVRRILRQEETSPFKLMATAVTVFFIAAGWGVFPLLNASTSFKPMFDHCDRLMKEGTEVRFFEPRETMSGGAVYYLDRYLPELHGEEALMQFLGSGGKKTALAESRRLRGVVKGYKISQSMTIGRRDYVFIETGDPGMENLSERSEMHDAIDG